MIVVYARSIPRPAIISTRSRKLSLKRRYQRAQRTHTEDDDFPVEMAALEEVHQYSACGLRSSDSAFTRKYLPLPLFAPEPDGEARLLIRDGGALRLASATKANQTSGIAT